MEMSMLYDSESYVVVQMDANEVPPGQPKRPGRPGFEVVDKKACKSVYLDGDLADLFVGYIHEWQERTPAQEEVEEVLAGFATIAQIPLVIQ